VRSRELRSSIAVIATYDKSQGPFRIRDGLSLDPTKPTRPPPLFVWLSEMFNADDVFGFEPAIPFPIPRYRPIFLWQGQPSPESAIIIVVVSSLDGCTHDTHDPII
jgi:hypothetical protein